MPHLKTDLPNCATPLLIENDIEELAPFFVYGMCGTGFLVQFRSRIFFVTAKHALARGDHNRIRVPQGLSSTELLQLGQFGFVSIPADEQDTDWADVAVFSVAPDCLGTPGEKDALIPAFLGEADTRHLLQPGAILTVRGFPREAPLARVNAEKKQIVIQALSTEAICRGLTESAACYELQFLETCPIRDFDMMSGSPVFFRVRHHDRMVSILVGMMLRAGGPERLGRFVSIEMVKRILEHHTDPVDCQPEEI